MGPLAGRRILITRAREQAEKTAALVRERGGEPVLLPTIELHPPADAGAVARAVAGARDHGWVVFTSANGVEWSWRAGLDAPGLGAARVAAIGPGTARALADRGARVDVVATDLKGEGLASAMLAAMSPGESVLLLRAQVARDVLPDALRAAGHRVDVVGVYETRPASGDEVARVVGELAAGAIDAVMFTSASTVDSFVALAGGAERAVELLARTVVASIGPVTGEALARHGLRVDCAARESTLAALLDAVGESLAVHPQLD